ncbi:unnamed protein product [Nezara viridula]|uniref:Methyltransferase domain-containing protein n=1 Tax=Nezara viridula TaxID=85310 RepID=A0A9P0HTD9_NEZVI|nr:unnamed protein product [Nezara viridula]
MDDPLFYITANSLQKRDAMDIVEERRDFLKWTSGERVLDIGCGPGDVTVNVLFPILPEDATLVGCDISEEMITYCNKFINNDRISFKTQNIEDKDIAEILELESFNKIFSFNCLHWIKDHRQAMENMFSLLKPGGEILLMFVTPNNPVLVMFYKLNASDKWSKYIKKRQWFYKADDPPSFFHQILEDVGFHNINCYLQKRSRRYPSLEALSDFLKPINPYLQYIPDELKSEYRQDLIDICKREGVVKFDAVTEELILEYHSIVAIAHKPNKQFKLENFMI